jgi:hypothetical protein
MCCVPTKEAKELPVVKETIDRKNYTFDDTDSAFKN